VTVVFTGGTISMRFDPVLGGPVPALTGAEILAQTPGLAEFARVSGTDFARLAGPHVTPTLMWQLSRDIAQLLDSNDVDGVVVTHGTDTLEESACLLDLVLASPKPVVFVGAMRNSSEASWDGPANLRSAIRVATAPQARDLGVLVVMNDQILAGGEAVKTNTESVDTFQARDFGPLGMVDKDRVLITRGRPRRENIPALRLEERVEIVKLSAGSDGRLLRHALDDGARGLVIEGLGRGNVPVTAIGEVERALASGVPIVVTSRCPRGRVLDTYAYPGAGKPLKRAGAILGGMVPSHKARLKLMLLLGAEAGIKEIRRAFEGEPFNG
jgi:L-asparaginase